MPNREGLPYAEAAELRHINENRWVCKTCNHDWGQDEHMARYCCATTRPCDKCGGVIPSKHYTLCNGCSDLDRRARWRAKPEVQWDGSFPVCLHYGDGWFFSIEELCEWMADNLEYEEGDDVGLLIDDLMLTTTTKRSRRRFDAEYLFEDYLAEDQDPPDCTELEKHVNDWLEANAPEVWESTGDRLRLSDIKSQIVQYWNDHSPT